MANSPRVISVTWAQVEGRRPRPAGSNARLGEHGLTVRAPLARIETDDGASGFGVCTATRARADALVGSPLSELFSPVHGTLAAARPFDYPLWDLAARRPARAHRRWGRPGFALLARLGQGRRGGRGAI